MDGDDAGDLRQFGYEQRLGRQIGPFSSFALAFSLISVFTGIFANFGHGLRHAGGTVVWSWLLVLGGQTLVAVVLAGLSRRMPLSGYGYQWTSRLANPHVGFFVGWLLALQFLTGFPGICATLATELGAAAGGWWAAPTGRTILTLAAIAAVTTLHLVGLRAAALVNDVGVWAELVGVTVVAAVLVGVAVVRGADPAALASTAGAPVGVPAGLGGWALSLLLGAWCLTGFEAAADLAEETRQPRQVVPRAMLTSLLAAGIAGAALLAGLVLAAPDLAAARSDPHPMPRILAAALGAGGSRLVLAVGALSIFACALASMAGASRLLYAMARDRMLPGARALAALDRAGRSPQRAILFVALISSVVVLVVPTLDVITQISAVAGYLGYAGIVATAAWARPAPGGATVGWGERAVAWAALAWVLSVVAALTIPPLRIAGVETLHLPARSTAIGIAVGIAVYLTTIRPRIRSGVAGPPPAGAGR